MIAAASTAVITSGGESKAEGKPPKQERFGENTPDTALPESATAEASKPSESKSAEAPAESAPAESKPAETKSGGSGSGAGGTKTPDWQDTANKGLVNYGPAAPKDPATGLGPGASTSPSNTPAPRLAAPKA